ncbi:MAG: hypothetical protein J6Y69_06305 [Treponema sp.]|nr:hypothetical protein [Treponema sp.]
MKKNYLFISIGAALLLLLSASSCGNLQLPETVSVKTNARFQAPLGTAKLDITEKLSSDMIREKIQEALGDDASVYVYAKDSSDDVLRYLIHYPAFNVPIDIGSYLDDMSFDANFSAMEKTVEFKAGDPLSLDKTISYNVNDITGQLADNGNFDPGASGTPLSEADGSIDSLYLPEVNVVNGTTDLNYEKIYYSSGSVQVTMNRTDANTVTPGYSLRMKAYLVPWTFNRSTDNPDAQYIARSNNGDWQDILTNPTLTIPLNVAEGIPMKFKFVFKAEASNGNPSVFHTYSPTASYENLKVKKITHLNSNDGIDLGNQDISVPLDSIPEAFQQIQFDNATITAISSNLPGWSGVSIGFASTDDFKFVGTGGALGANSITETSPSGTGDYLINKAYTASATINPQSGGTVSVHVKPTLTIDDATIYFGEDGNSNQTLSAAVSFRLNTIKQAKVNLETLGITGISLPTDGAEGSIELPGELLRYVNSINFTANKTDADGNSTSTPRNGFGLKCKVTNTLPAGNNISFTIRILKDGSNGYEKTATIPVGSNNTAVDWTQKPCTIVFPTYDGNPHYLSLSAEIDGAEEFVLQNLELGHEYTFGISDTEFVYDWDSVSLNLSGVNYEEETDLPFDMSSLMENFSIIGDEIRKIEVDEFPFYLYAKTPSGSALASRFGSIGLEGQLYIKYKEGTQDKYMNLFTGAVTDSVPSSGTIGFKDDIPWPGDSSQVIIGNVSDPNNIAYYLRNEEASLHADLKNILSLTDTTATDIKLHYNIGLSGASNETVYQSMLPAPGSNESVNLSVDLATILSFDFSLKAPVSADIMAMLDEHYNEPGEDGMYKDILNRSNISSESEYQKYINAIKEVGINYQLVNELFINDDEHKMEFMVKIDDLAEADGYTGLNKVFPLNQGNDKITFSGTEIENIMTHRFHPTIKLNLGRPLAEGETNAYLSNKSKLSVSRSGLANREALSANVVVYVQMNGDEPIQVWGGQE